MKLILFLIKHIWVAFDAHVVDFKTSFRFTIDDMDGLRMYF